MSLEHEEIERIKGRADRVERFVPSLFLRFPLPPSPCHNLYFADSAEPARPAKSLYSLAKSTNTEPFWSRVSVERRGAKSGEGGN